MKAHKPTESELIQKYLNDRDEACRAPGLEKFKIFLRKYNLPMFRNIKKATGAEPEDKVLEITKRYILLGIQAATPEEKREAVKWIAENGHKLPEHATSAQRRLYNEYRRQKNG